MNPWLSHNQAGPYSKRSNNHLQGQPLDSDAHSHGSNRWVAGPYPPPRAFLRRGSIVYKGTLRWTTHNSVSCCRLCRRPRRQRYCRDRYRGRDRARNYHSNRQGPQNRALQIGEPFCAALTLGEMITEQNQEKTISRATARGQGRKETVARRGWSRKETETVGWWRLCCG